MKKKFPRALNKLWHVLAAVIIVAALLVSISGLLTPVLNEHRKDIETLASNLLKTPVKIQDIKISWHGYEPELSLSNVTILDNKSQQVKLTLQQLDIDFSILRSLFARTFFVETLTISGVDLTIKQLPSDELQIGNLTTINLKAMMEDNASETEGISQWVFSQPGLIFKDFRVHVILPQKEHFILLKKFSLINKQEKHIVKGNAVLIQEIPTKIDLHLDWVGDIKNIKEADSHLYFNLQNLSLPQWFANQTWGGFKLIGGLTNSKIWVSWAHNQIYQLQTEFNASGLQFYSSILKQPEVINNIKGMVGWKQIGNRQEFVGDKIVIELPKYFWPETHFTASVMDNDSGLTLNHLTFNYLNLSDVSRVILESNLISDELRNTLMMLQLQGEMNDVEMTMSPNAVLDVQHLTFNGKVNNFSMMPWEKFPGVKHLSGILSWNGKNGNLAVDSKQLELTINQLFKKPLILDNMNSTVNFALNDQGDWLCNVPHFHIDNKDIIGDARFTFTIPKTSTPTIDLIANFALLNAAHITPYLPQKEFDPDLNKWLENAFISGQADGGKVVVRGNLSDFPFDTNPNAGKFFISANVKNVDFNYAPDWPHLKNVNGQLTFSGSTMTADINSAKILNIPLSNVHGVIPYLGTKAPQILNVNAAIQTDAANGFDFIQQSPLRETIGKELAAMKLSGPMQLKLGLEVPLKRPSLTRVTGDVLLSGALLSLPDWGLQFNHINGGFTFTEDGIEAKEIRGDILGNEALLGITTLHEVNKPGQVQANLSSVMNLNNLQDWLQVNFSNIAKGVTPYQVQLFLSAQADKKSQQDRIVLSSTLKGVELNLPKPYGKEASEEKNLQVSVDLGDAKALNVKVDLDKFANAALTFYKSKKGFELFGGELRLGDTNANWQKAPGILITGNIPELDISIWQNYFSSLQNSSVQNQFSWKLFRGLNLNANEIKAMGLELHHANLQAERSDYNWHMNVDSNELTGSFTLPLKWGDQPIEGRIQKLNVVSANIKETTEHLDPHVLPAMSLDIDSMNYNAMTLGHISLMLVPASHGVSINKLTIEEPNLKVNASGQWVQSNKQYYTRLNGQMSALKIGDVLTQWGFNSSNLVGSTGDVKFDLQWPNAPYQPSLAGLSGKVNVKLGEGRIINLSESTNSKMGLGRLLNIFSLSSLPRRLSSDFSDVQQGYDFDSMSGDFNFKNGNAFIDSMTFDGPIAGLILKGRVGLIARDLNVQLGIMPHVTGSLPVVAAIAGGPVVGPAVGIATWLVDRVMTHEASKSSKYEYNITGSWDNPVWQKLDGYGRWQPNQ